MAAITEGATLRFVVFAAAEANLLFFIGILIIAFKNELEGFVSAAFLVVRAIAEWLILRSATCAVVVCFTLLECHFVRLSLCDNSLFTSFEFLAVVDITLSLSHLF